MSYNLIKEFIDEYESLNFYNIDKSLNLTTNVKRLTKILEDKGLIRNNKFQYIDDISIYPQEYFSPYDYANYINTYCEHLFLVSWLPWYIKLRKIIKKITISIIGIDNMNKLRKLK